MSFLKHSDTAIIVLHEIYGVNSHILEVCEYYKKAGFDIICPNMLNRESFDYVDEEEAYEYFLKNVGFNLASKIVTDLIVQAKQEYKYVFLLGFSIGATIAWLCSDKECNGIIGYYGSRIRDYININPKSLVLLIFAAEEKSFNVMEVVAELNKKTNVDVNMLPGKHGFSDPFSIKYYEESDKAAIRLVEKFIKNRR